MRTISLYRPTGQNEWDLVAQSGFTKWPARLPGQPIFYPVTNERYASEIAKKWNTNSQPDGGIGYVTKCEVDAEYLDQFESHCVGAAHHREYWIPAERLEEFNSHIVGKIQLIKKYP
jgi:hypothetical protein